MIKMMMLLMLTSSLCNAQIKVFKNSEDYKNNVFQPYEEFSKMKFADHNTQNVIFIDKNGSKVTVNSNDMLGFSYKDVLFTFLRRSTWCPMIAVRSVGKVVYYENGAAWMEMLKKDKTNGEFKPDIQGNMINFSLTLDSPVYTGKEAYDTIFRKDPKYDALVNCLTLGITYPKKFDKDDNTRLDYKGWYIYQTYIVPQNIDRVRSCVKAFNEE